MKKLKLFGLAVMAMLSLSIVATSAAQAVELRFLPEKVKFGFKSNGATFLETLSGKKIECKKVEGSGEAASERLGKVEFKFKECAEPAAGIKCTGLSDTTSGNITVNAEFHLRHLLETKKEWVNLSILVTAHFSCLIALFVVSGCVTSDDLLTDEKQNVVNLLLKLFLINFLIKAGSKGDAEVGSIDTDNSLGMEACELLTKEGNAVAESSAQSGSGVVENFTNAKGEPVTILIDLKGEQ